MAKIHMTEEGPLEQRAQEIISEAVKEILRIEKILEEHKETIKDIKDDCKGEGINIKALNEAIKRYKAFLAGKKEIEDNLTESDIYLEVLKENLV